MEPKLTKGVAQSGTRRRALKQFDLGLTALALAKAPHSHFLAALITGLFVVQAAQAGLFRPDFPMVQLRSMQNGQTVFLLPTNWSANSFPSVPVSDFPPGFALATVFVNGIPGTSSILNITVPVPTVPFLAGARKLPNGSFQFSFTNTPGVTFSLLASTFPAMPSSEWMVLGSVIDISPGDFQFTDAQATNFPQRFYRVRSP